MTAPQTEPHIFVLDTNVLIDDPRALYRFGHHHIFLPMVVLEELDASKKGVSEIARNVREASRILGELTAGANREQIEQGLAIANALEDDARRGKLFFQTEPPKTNASGKTNPPSGLLRDTADNAILASAIDLQSRLSRERVTLVSRDINLRIRAQVLGINAEDYRDGQVIDDVDVFYTGIVPLPSGVADQQPFTDLLSKKQSEATVAIPAGETWFTQLCLHHATSDTTLRVLAVNNAGTEATLRVTDNFSAGGSNVWGIRARNREQNFALNLLLDDEVDFVSIVGAAGTGKTLLALAAGLAQTLEDKRYKEIVVTRVTVPVGEDIGFLPGTEEEKMTPWMGALMDNLEVLSAPADTGEWGRAATNDVLLSRIKIRSLNFMRGRTFLNRFVIIDEAQNLTKQQMRTLVTRAGPGTKVVCLGNVGQIDTPYLTETTTGLTYVVERMKTWQHSGHVTLLRGERSRLADFAESNL